MDTPGLGVEVQIGTAFIPSGNNYPYVVFMDASENVTLATPDSSNPRIDLIVAYVDLSVVSSTNPNNPNALKLDNVSGTPAGSPSVPNNAAIQAVIGASNPYIVLAQVAVAAATPTITDSNIVDSRVVGGSELAYAERTTNFSTTSTTDVQVTSLTVNVNVPPGGKKLKITAMCPAVGNSGAGNAAGITIWDGPVGGGVKLKETVEFSVVAGDTESVTLIARTFMTSVGVHQFNVGLRANATTAAINSTSNSTSFLMVEAI